LPHILGLDHRGPHRFAGELDTLLMDDVTLNIQSRAHAGGDGEQGDQHDLGSEFHDVDSRNVSVRAGFS
jgi:hypothetical protein